MTRNIISGIFIGVANIIPGISGGTVALLLGIYEDLTESLGKFFEVSKERRIEFIKFLFQIFLGVFVGLIGFAKIIGFLYDNFREPTSFLFLGMIIASLPMVLNHRDHEHTTTSNKIWFFIGTAIMFSFILIQFFYDSNVNINNSLIFIDIQYSLKLILSGVIAGGSMIIPGISGSLLLLILGEYYNILKFVNNREIFPILLIGIGVGIGILSFARVIDKLLKSYKDNTLYFIIGLILVSLIEVWPGFTLTIFNALFNIIAFILGIYIVELLKKTEGRKDEKK